MMKQNILTLAVLLLLFSCNKSKDIKKDIVGKYRKLVKTVEDSILTAITDTSQINPILEKLTATTNWEKEKKNWERNPFIPPKIEKKPPVVKKKTKPKINISFTGIIDNGNEKKALLNGRLYRVGDTIKNMRVVKIGSRSVTLRSSQETVKLFLREKR